MGLAQAPADVDALLARIERLEQEGRALKQEGRALKQEVRALKQEVRVLQRGPAGPALPARDPEGGPVTRRRLIGMAGAATAGAVGGAMLAASPAAADDPNDITIDAAKSGVGTTSLTSTVAAGGASTLFVNNTSGTTGAGLRANAGGNGTGVEGNATSGAGVFGIATNGVGVVATASNGNALRADPPQGQTGSNVWLLPHLTVAGPPTSVEHFLGQFWMDMAGVLWQCVAPGTPGTWVRQSSLVTLAAPFRVYDSRVGQPNPSTSTQGVLAFGGGARTINCTPTPNPTGATLPAGTSAVLFNVTLANTVGAVGSVVVWANGASEPMTASITWTGSSVVVGNAVTSACDVSQDVQIKCTTGSSTNVILDVIGFYV